MASHQTEALSPRHIYGTAWKVEETRPLVSQAISAGFRAFDTAAQPKHYREDLLGVALRLAIASGELNRHRVWIQTKFTSVTAQDNMTIPYDEAAPLQLQLITSVAGSLKNLNHQQTLIPSIGDAYLDCLLLHAPFQDPSLTLEAWDIMCSLVPHPVRALGIANIELSMLKLLIDHMRIKPTVVQNPFWGSSGYDKELRSFCTQEGIIYQAFWVLKRNVLFLRSSAVVECAMSVGISPEAALFALLRLDGVVVLNGTTKQERMVADMQSATTFDKFVNTTSGMEKAMVWLDVFREITTDMKP